MQVLFRYVLNLRPWTEEARFTMIFVTFWGAATAMGNEHITICVI